MSDDYRVKVLRDRMSDASKILNGALYDIQFKGEKSIYKKLEDERAWQVQEQLSKAQAELKRIGDYETRHYINTCVLKEEIERLQILNAELFRELEDMKKKKD